MRERIGILGGVFDPVHNGHILLARAAKEELHLDRVVLLPSGNPPHKHPHVETEDRLNMLLLAAEDGMVVSRREIQRSGKTYTVDTLSEMRREFPEVEIFYIIGADTLSQLKTWKDFDRVAQMCTFAVFARPGAEGEAPANARVLRLRTPGPDISSTAVRASASRREDLCALVPGPVARYIRENGLYLMNVSLRQARELLRERLSTHRFAHTLGVMETARRLSALHGADCAAAGVAGLLHDAAKSLDLAEMRKLVSKAKISVDPLEWESVSLLHAAAGVAIAMRDFGVCDPEILSSIRRHTLGGPNMQPLDLILYLADFIEPNREDFPGLAQVRALAERDLRKAALRAAELTEEYVRQSGGKPHPGTAELIKELRGEMR